MALELTYDRDVEPLSLDAALGRLHDKGFDCRDDHLRDHGAQVLAGLNANTDIVANAATNALEETYKTVLETTPRGYSPQVIRLGEAGNGWYVRANIWPAMNDYVFQSSGPEAFFYGLPHDHNFHFLTIGHFGPGYDSDYYEYDTEKVHGYRGEKVDLTFVERSTLSPGRMLHYRAYRDVHVQRPPKSLSVSLNIMQGHILSQFRDQYLFDLESKTITEVVGHDAADALLRISVMGGDMTGKALAHHIVEHHEGARLAHSAWAALASAAQDDAERQDILHQGHKSRHASLRGEARRLEERMSAA